MLPALTTHSVQNLLCIVIADSILSKFGGDSMNQLKMHIKNTAKY